MPDNVIRLPGAIVNGDFSTRQFYAVRLTGSTSVDFEIGPTTANTQKPIGILVNDPDTSGHAAEVAIAGVTKVQLGGASTAGNSLGPDAAGRLVAVAEGDSGSSGRFVIGIALQSGTSGEIIYARLVDPHISWAGT